MTEKIDLKKIEKQAFRFSLQDGLYDIAYGTLLISFALAPFLREIIGLGYMLIVVPPAPLILILGKKYIVIPRIGIVKFDLKRREAKKKITIISAILFPLTVLAVILTIIGIFPGSYVSILGQYTVPIGAGIFAIILLSICAYLMDFPHMYLYGLAIGFGIPITELLEPIVGDPMNGLIALGIPGLLLLIFGIISFSKFLHKYPIPKEGILK
jgi:hypothetical protein